jgi:hypothetical protein
MVVEVGGIYKSKKCGEYEILCRNDQESYNKFRTCYDIKFLKTKYVTTVRVDQINTGSIKDPYFPSVCGIGYLGEPKNEYRDPYIYNRWNNMINNCYNDKYRNYSLHGALGITVCKRWHCYANFAEDIESLPGYDDMINNPKKRYRLVIVQQNTPENQKIYSPETCILINQ